MPLEKRPLPCARKIGLALRAELPAERAEVSIFSGSDETEKWGRVVKFGGVERE
jgi:hypothetical protein